MADDNNQYPFAGYKQILGEIFAKVMLKAPCHILDVGIGTGTLAAKLYEAGNIITGIDFSDEMLKIAKAKMPDARLIRHNFTKGLPIEFAETFEKFDFIISTYALHHLTDEEKPVFIEAASKLLAPNGLILIGDVAFATHEMHDECRAGAEDGWDDDEFYIIYENLSKFLGGHLKTNYQQISHCGGLLEVRPQ